MASQGKRPVAVVVGVGPGLGAALARRFAAEYRVALVARSEDYLATLAKEISAAVGETCPSPAIAASAEEISRAFDTIRRELDPHEALVYNAAMRPLGRLMETKPSTFENTWRVCALGAFLCSREVVPDMLKRGKGVILFTGATAGIKPFATSAAFGPAKFAMRGLAQSLARDLGPKGIHVAWINVDGSIDIPGRKVGNYTSEDMLSPDAIAETYWHLAHQDRSAWTMELEVRPFKEKF